VINRPNPLLPSLCVDQCAQSQRRCRYVLADRERTSPRGRHASKYIDARQATNVMEAVKFAKLINLPLVAHLTIHWSLTDVGDDPNGKLFAKLREGLDKWLNRHGIEFCGGVGARTPIPRPVRRRALSPYIPPACALSKGQEAPEGRGGNLPSHRATWSWHHS